MDQGRKGGGERRGEDAGPSCRLVVISAEAGGSSWALQGSEASQYTTDTFLLPSNSACTANQIAAFIISLAVYTMKYSCSKKGVYFNILATCMYAYVWVCVSSVVF